MPDNDKASNKMLSFAPAPIFTGWDHRPSVSSPLSSSPIRATSPLSPADENTLSQRQTQSSPIQPPKFKYATRTTRPNPVMRRREDAQAQRRRTFLQSVRDKAEDKAWQRRDIEGHFLKTNWLADMSQLSYDAPEFTDADIEDAVEFQPETPQPIEDDDEIIMDDAEGRDFEEMMAAFDQDSARPPSPALSDEEYDAIFAELISQEQEQQQGQEGGVDAMEMS